MLTKVNYSDRITFVDAGMKLKKPWKCKGFQTCEDKKWIIKISKYLIDKFLKFMLDKLKNIYYILTGIEKRTLIIEQWNNLENS